MLLVPESVSLFNGVSIILLFNGLQSLTFDPLFSLLFCTYLLLRELQEGREYCLRFCELSLLSRGYAILSFIVVIAHSLQLQHTYMSYFCLNSFSFYFRPIVLWFLLLVAVSWPVWSGYISIFVMICGFGP